MFEICRHSTAAAFLERAERWLLEAEMQRMGPYASARHARIDDSMYPRPIYWATIEESGRLIGCAYRTPPYKVGVTELPREALEPLVASLREFYRSVSGFSGPEPTTSALAELWCKRQGGTVSVASRSRLYCATSIAALPSLPAGALRLAQRADAALVQAWGDAGASENRLPELNGTLCVELMRVGKLYLWDDGRPRAMLGVLRETSQGPAIGVVYTSTDWRRQRYAAAAVSAFARATLARGTRCFFHIDAANGPLNALAARLGFEPIQEAVDIDVR